MGEHGSRQISGFSPGGFALQRIATSLGSSFESFESKDGGATRLAQKTLQPFESKTSRGPPGGPKDLENKWTNNIHQMVISIPVGLNTIHRVMSDAKNKNLWPNQQKHVTKAAFFFSSSPPASFQGLVTCSMASPDSTKSASFCLMLSTSIWVNSNTSPT